MREQLQHQVGGSEEMELQAGADHHRADQGTTYSSGGTIPPVAQDGSGITGPSASDRAYGTQAVGFGPVGGIGAFGGLGTKPQTSQQLPLVKNEDLEAQVAQKEAEKLLSAKGMDTEASAKKALDYLVNLPDSYRGKVIDHLAPKAFRGLIDHNLADADRERFYSLIEVSQDPERKLALWAEAHKARATNNVERKKGDIGGPIPTYEEENDDGQMVQELDEEEEEKLRKHLKPGQLRNRKRHFRRQKAAETTQTEVDSEVNELTSAHAKNKTALSLQEVNELIERKELEYKVELESNVNLTNESSAHPQFGVAHWKKDELVEVQRVLARVPQAQDPDGIEELRRVHERGPGVGGMYHDSDNSIDVTAWGVSKSPGYRHGGDDRQLVSDDYKAKNGDKIGTLEFVLTHEIGHNYDAKHTKEYEAFQKAAGWTKVKVDALHDDGVSDADIVRLEDRRANPNAKTSDIKGRTKIFSPDAGSKDEYWAVPITAIPAEDEAEPSSTGDDSWTYARVNPDEHFAETYAKAVHVPGKLYDDLVLFPQMEADEARAEYEKIKSLLDKEQRKAPSRSHDLSLINIKSMAASAKAKLVRLETARDQRKAQYDVMRNTVFGTDKAVKLSVERLRAKHVSEDKIEELIERSKAASTPEQVAVLEANVSK